MRLSHATVHIMAGCGLEEGQRAHKQWMSLVDFQVPHRLTVEAWYHEKSDTIQVALCMQRKDV